MRCQNDRFEIGLASSKDGVELLKIYESGDFKGNISVLFTRRPNPYESLMYEGENVVVPIVRDKDNGKIVGMGACVIRKAYINGEIKRIGYLTGLKVLPQYQKRLKIFFEVYKYLYDLTKDSVDVYYTTILQENTSVKKMFAKKRAHMPEYRYLGEYTVHCIGTGNRTKGWDFKLENGSINDLAKIYHEKQKKFNFSHIKQSFYGLAHEDIYILKDKDDKVIAACGIWNQQGFKQYIISEYKGIYKYLKKLPIKFFGYPDLPTENIPANYGNITMLYVKNNDISIGKQFIKKVAERANRYNFLMVGFFENYPLVNAMQKIKSIKYQSSLYRVIWDNNEMELDQKCLNIEVGFL